VIADKYAIGRIIVHILLGMFTAYTLVSLFGLIIGTVLTMLVLFAYIKTLPRIIDVDNNSNIVYYNYNSTNKVRYKCLVCYYSHNKRECPKCGSKMKQVEF